MVETAKYNVEVHVLRGWMNGLKFKEYNSRNIRVRYLKGRFGVVGGGGGGVKIKGSKEKLPRWKKNS